MGKVLCCGVLAVTDPGVGVRSLRATLSSAAAKAKRASAPVPVRVEKLELIDR
ncbi:hypothetical protein [Pseudomonas sp. PDM14]|uniref:hypothetical protein n=1 Tax=Pseudomonas sp. PDM14 TaxID=2769288 RepID=UPI001CE127A2|nr:hypothetical protein [Pseudomonas sp. PDM14]